jgi:hypothetical protein
MLVAAPTCSSLLVRSLTAMGNPKQALLRMYELLQAYLAELKGRCKGAPDPLNTSCDKLHEAIASAQPRSAPPPGAATAAGSGGGAAAADAGSGEERSSDPEASREPSNKETASMMHSRWAKLTKARGVPPSPSPPPLLLR